MEKSPVGATLEIWTDYGKNSLVLKGDNSSKSFNFRFKVASGLFKWCTVDWELKVFQESCDFSVRNRLKVPITYLFSIVRTSSRHKSGKMTISKLIWFPWYKISYRNWRHYIYFNTVSTDLLFAYHLTRVTKNNTSV